MAEEKRPASPAGGVVHYPEVPPPAYCALPTAPSATQLLAVPVATTNDGSVFSNIPAARYDTMTSYLGDGSGVHTVVANGAILDRPILVRCPFCQTTVTTETKPVAGCLTWLCCLAISAVGLFYGCCLIPFCSRRLRDIQHYCPKCHNLVALYKRL